MRQLFISTVLVLFLGFLPTINRAQSNEYTSFGPTTAQSQLTQIALDTRPDKSISPQQMMIAIQQLNPGHFSQSNINGLHKGIQLKIPTLALVKKVDPTVAESLVNEQNKQWNSHQIQKILATKQRSVSQKVSQPALNASSSVITPSATLAPAVPALQAASSASHEHSVSSAPMTLASQSDAHAATTPRATKVTPLSQESVVPPHSQLLKTLVDQLSAQVHRLEAQYSPALANLHNAIDQSNLRLDNLEKENIALKNQVILVSNAVSELADKMVSQDQAVNQKISALQENQSNMKAFFAEYGGYLMISLGLIILAALSYGLLSSRRRRIAKDQLSKVNSDTNRKTSHSFVDQRSSPLFQSNKPTLASNQQEPSISTPVSKPAMHDTTPQPHPQVTTESCHEDPEDEYDYLNSEEGIAAKLDLARAYIDMGDYETARQVLREVRATGKPHLQHQAQQILDKMSVTTTQ